MQTAILRPDAQHRAKLRVRFLRVTRVIHKFQERFLGRTQVRGGRHGVAIGRLGRRRRAGPVRESCNHRQSVGISRGGLPRAPPAIFARLRIAERGQGAREIDLLEDGFEREAFAVDRRLHLRPAAQRAERVQPADE